MGVNWSNGVDLLRGVLWGRGDVGGLREFRIFKKLYLQLLA